MSNTVVTAVHASSAAKVSTLNSQVTNLQRSLTQDEAVIEQLERKIWGLDARLLEIQRDVRKERDEQRAAFHDIKREAKKQLFDIEAIEKSIALIDQDIGLVQRDSQRSQEYFNSLNPIKKQFAEASHLDKQQQNQAKVEELLLEKQTLIESLNSHQAKQALLNKKLELARQSMEDTSIEADPRYAKVSSEREVNAERITAMRKQFKQDQANLSLLQRRLSDAKSQLAKDKQAAVAAVANIDAQQAAPQQISGAEGSAATASKGSAYVFVVSGDQEPNIEQELKLKDWVESYGATYIQAHWNGFDSSNLRAGSTEIFKAQFAKQLNAIEKDAKIILIGHGRGGGAAIEAATDVAFNTNRSIEFLAVIDPIGDDNLRANIVYDAPVKCNKPIPKDQISNTEYVTCLRESKKRIITANVKHFYNRWQKDGKGPEDFYRRIRAIGDNGEDVVIPTATGRFATADTITQDQKRVFLGDDKDAHVKLLEEEARNLPRLLVKHLR